MRDPFLATRELNICAKFQVRSSKTVAATLRTNIHIPYIHRTYRGETGETRGKPKYVAELRTGQNTVQVCEIVQFSDQYWSVKGTDQWESTDFPLSVSINWTGVPGKYSKVPLSIFNEVFFCQIALNTPVKVGFPIILDKKLSFLFHCMLNILLFPETSLF